MKTLLKIQNAYFYNNHEVVSVNQDFCQGQSYWIYSEDKELLKEIGEQFLKLKKQDSQTIFWKGISIDELSSDFVRKKCFSFFPSKILVNEKLTVKQFLEKMYFIEEKNDVFKEKMNYALQLIGFDPKKISIKLDRLSEIEKVLVYLSIWSIKGTEIIIVDRFFDYIETESREVVCNLLVESARVSNKIVIVLSTKRFENYSNFNFIKLSNKLGEAI